MPRLDQLLVSQGLVRSRTRAQRLIRHGRVSRRDDGKVLTRPGEKCPDDLALVVAEDPEERYVSRAGLKLEAVLSALELSLDGRLVLDVGQSTGGFTDCALAAGALIYGAYYGDIASPSYAKFGGPEFDLPVADLAVYREMLLDPARPDDLARLRLDDADLADLPPVHVYGAGLDPLLDDSVRLAAALRAAGNAGDLAVYPGVVHAFIHYSRMVDQAGRLIDDVSAALARDLAP